MVVVDAFGRVENGGLKDEHTAPFRPGLQDAQPLRRWWTDHQRREKGLRFGMDAAGGTRRTPSRAAPLRWVKNGGLKDEQLLPSGGVLLRGGSRSRTALIRLAVSVAELPDTTNGMGPSVAGTNAGARRDRRPKTGKGPRLMPLWLAA